MPNETTSPFQPNRTRKTNDTELVAGVLGTDAAADMEALVGGQAEPLETEPQPQGLELTEDEQAATTKAEKTKAELRYDEYVIWANEFGMDQEWVEETFIFEPDGRVRVEGDLILTAMGISELPPDLCEVKGNLKLNSNKIAKIANIPDSVTFIDFRGNQITEIENIPDSVISLYLDNNKITKIENIPDSVTDLFLGNNQITRIENIPDSVIWLNLVGNQIEIIENIPDSVTDVYLSNNQIKVIDNIPESVTKLYLSNNQITKIENIPDSVTELCLDKNKITKIENIPDSVTELRLDNNPIESLEPLVGRKFQYLLINKIKATTIPEGIEVEKIYLDSSQTELIADCVAKGYEVKVK